MVWIHHTFDLDIRVKEIQKSYSKLDLFMFPRVCKKKLFKILINCSETGNTLITKLKYSTSESTVDSSPRNGNRETTFTTFLRELTCQYLELKPDMHSALRWSRPAAISGTSILSPSTASKGLWRSEYRLNLQYFPPSTDNICSFPKREQVVLLYE